MPLLAGSFDLPVGPGQGNGSGGAKGIRGTVASADFGSGIATPGRGDGRSSGRGNAAVQTSGFGAQEVAQVTPHVQHMDTTPTTTAVEITFKPNPVYTDEARKLKLEGEVLLEVMFGANGQLQVIRVVRGLGHGLDEAAIAAAAQNTFQARDPNWTAHRFDSNRARCISIGVLKLEMKVMRTLNWIGLALLVVTMTAAAQQAASAPQNPQPASQTTTSQPDTQPQALPTTMDQVVDRVIGRERPLVKFLAPRTPLVETYLQNLTQDTQLGPIPLDDRYFLGRMDLSESIDRSDFLKDQKGKDETMEKHLLGGFSKRFKFQYQALGFSWMIFADRDDFDRQHYDFHYVRREFMGDIRCLVFDITPKKDAGRGRFLGRIWVEDQDFNIVRLNGTYAHAKRSTYYFHMDSWRLNLVPGYWVPAYIYSEEGDFTAGAKNKIAFKAQTRLWGYNLKASNANDEAHADPRGQRERRYAGGSGCNSAGS